ncbi:hypothetical protein L249_0809 [Ophiocordyceps polyrhachis-furcata BCC 54312]|uniref:C2H2-type domain-containing protein n=1 Tax=Ophiocordyceps polyrhachis-furcata BCC 54312 TaxID=1330021 RepID=A0A367LFU6_9HYPO|nr:hypothetical protein L249_0809 [Ophiocordyceps polyrhachis-furcata BCC 54312]
MAVPLVPTQFIPSHGEYYRHAQLPQPPPSPPMEDAKCSLPSISKLLGLVDGGSCSSSSSSSYYYSHAEPFRTEGKYRASCRPKEEADILFQSYADSRPDSGYGKSSRGMPPTPPMGADASFDGGYNNNSPRLGKPGRFYETTPPLDADLRRQQISNGRPPLRQSLSSAPFPAAYYHQSPMAAAAAAAAGTPSPHPQISNLFYQQPLPQTFPPLSVPVVVAPSSGANPWQHHHYLSPSHSTGYPQNQDRYICQTCNKAFSRPSSLRIHSHSHTGEKPFKCPHAGCGKAFSVRSNMKRHERGCHSFDSRSSISSAAGHSS